MRPPEETSHLTNRKLPDLLEKTIPQSGDHTSLSEIYPRETTARLFDILSDSKKEKALR
jgi:hypothetical protein